MILMDDCKYLLLNSESVLSLSNVRLTVYMLLTLTNDLLFSGVLDVLFQIRANFGAI